MKLRGALAALLSVPVLCAIGVTPAVAASGPQITLDPPAVRFGVSTTVTVSGDRCYPSADAPASVFVTVDGLAGQVFAATPGAAGNWQADVTVDPTADSAFVFHASCDDYLGTFTYPDATLDEYDILGIEQQAPPAAIPTPTPTPTSAALANTGPPTGALTGVGALLIVAGAGVLAMARRGRPSRG